MQNSHLLSVFRRKLSFHLNHSKTPKGNTIQVQPLEANTWIKSNQSLLSAVVKPTTVTLLLADRSVKVPGGIVEGVLVQVDKFIYPVDFIVLDTQHIQTCNSIPIILGHPFLSTSNALINCRNRLLKLSFGNMTLEMNIFNICKQPDDDNDF